jgi:hypothetical protein
VTLTTFLYEVWSTAAGTASYLLAYRGALVLAILAAAAGLVAFFCAAPMTPTRLLRFRRDLGMRAAVTLALLLTGTAVASGMITAVLYRLTGLTIHYKLIPEQLL